MLIKEYRIPMPMSVDEYRIAQLYMIQKKSREESCGEGSGVEILANKPYQDGPGGSGQYTHKVYHIGKHIPSWFCAILPQAALRVEEESWNAYPYTRTRYTCPFVEKFSIDIETFYRSDSGQQEDVFHLSPAERRQRTVDPIDIVKDYIAPHEYLAEEDPTLYRSLKTGRGPLSEDWVQEIDRTPGQSEVMCAYKLCKVEFRYWGMQSKIEAFIHDVGLRKVMVRAHRQAWCWQDEWYGLTIEDIRRLELETQLALARKMAQYSLTAEPEADRDQGCGVGENGQGSPESRGELTKQRSTSSHSSRRGAGSPAHQSISEWRMESIARDSDESADEEFFDAHEDLSPNQDLLVRDISKGSSDDLMDEVQTTDLDEPDELTYQEVGGVSAAGIKEMKGAPSSPPTSKIHLLVLVLHGGNLLDSGSADPSSKQDDVNTLAAAFQAVMRVHYPAAAGRVAIRAVPCPAVCTDAFSLVSNLSPHGYDRTRLCSSQDHIPLAALPLLATSAPQYQDAVAAVILRANRVFHDFVESSEGEAFSGQVCLVGDCVGGILGFDVLCSSSVCETPSSSRRGSGTSAQVRHSHRSSTRIDASGGRGSQDSDPRPSLDGSRQLGHSNVDVAHASDDPKRRAPRKHSDSSAAEPDTLTQHQAFFSSLHSSALHGESRRSSSSTVQDGGSLGKLDFQVTDFFLFGSPLGLVLALRKTAAPWLDVSTLRPACRQLYNLFHPADPSASRLEPLLDRRFHLLPPFSVPRYQSFPLGDGHSPLLVETVQTNSQLLTQVPPHLEPDAGRAVPLLNRPASATQSDADSPHICVDGPPSPSPASPGLPPLRRSRRASEASAESQVSGSADAEMTSYIASALGPRPRPSLLSHLPLPYRRFASSGVSPRLRRKLRQVFPRQAGSESLSSDLSSDPTSDLTGLTSDLADMSSNITDFSSPPPSPGVLRNLEQVASRWWGSKRLDYALYCPDALTAFPTVALPHLFHASYWESSDVVSFLLRQVMRHECSGMLELDGTEVAGFTPSRPREKWLRKRTHVKIRNMAANHRGTDGVFAEDGAQTVAGRFMYGPLDMVTLTGEKVDVHVMTRPPSGDWVHFSSELSSSSGRVSVLLPESRRLGVGVYPVKMVVRGDHTSADSYLTVVPRGTRFVAFSIDGSFAASVSIMGSDPKVRAGAVDVVRFWQDLGYLIVYVTGRPDMQKRRVVAWLSQHNFPHGVVSFCDGLVHDPLRHKAGFLRSLVSEAHMRIFAAYGSTKDIPVYSSAGLPPTHIYIVGRPSKKTQHRCQFISDGYASHLSQLEHHQRSGPAESTGTRTVLRTSSFGLGTAGGDLLRKRGHVFRSVSSQQPSSPGRPGRAERTLSQREVERDRGPTGAQRSMSIAAGCWGRTGSTKGGGGGPK
ncbi:membrane-associated phosphatidylinositol transfer protein 2 [Neosynchiropus ocellatus]